MRFEIGWTTLVERINSKNIEGITAEFVHTGSVFLDKPPAYAVIVDRISHDVAFYRAFPKHVALWGSVILNIIPSGGPLTTSSSTTRSPQSLALPFRPP